MIKDDEEYEEFSLDRDEDIGETNKNIQILCIDSKKLLIPSGTAIKVKKEVRKRMA